MSYPEDAGYKAPGPSAEAAATTDARSLRDAVVRWLRANGAASADQVAGGLGASVLAIRPRLSELRRQGVVEDAGFRVRNASGKRATVWRLTRARRGPAQPPLF